MSVALQYVPTSCAVYLAAIYPFEVRIVEEFREGTVKSFVNVEGFFERNENVARIGAMINKKRHRDGISHTKFSTPNGAKVHIESRARFVAGHIAYEHIVRCLGKSTHITRDKIVALDIIRGYGGYHDTYRYQGQRNLKTPSFNETTSSGRKAAADALTLAGLTATKKLVLHKPQYQLLFAT